MLFLAQIPTQAPELPPGPGLEHLRGPVEMPPYAPWQYAVAAIAIALVLAALVYVIIRILRQKPKAYSVTPYEAFLGEINAAQMARDDDPRNIAILSQAVRRYLQDTILDNKPGLTSSELLRKLHNHPIISAEESQTLAKLFEDFDRGKFSPTSNRSRSIEHLAEASLNLIDSIHAKQTAELSETKENHPT